MILHITVYTDYKHLFLVYIYTLKEHKKIKLKMEKEFSHLKLECKALKHNSMNNSPKKNDVKFIKENSIIHTVGIVT